MNKLFLGIYDFLQRHRALCYSLMVGSFLLMVWFAAQVRFEEDVTRFFPDTEEAHNSEVVFNNLKIKDKIVFMLSAKDTTQSEIPERLIAAGDTLRNALLYRGGDEYIQYIMGEVGSDMVGQMTDFIYAHLPLFLNDADYARMDSLFTEEAIDHRMQANMRNLLSPAGSGLKEILPRDPLGLGTPAFEALRDMQMTANYAIYDNHIFSPDLSTLIFFLTPRYSTGSTGKNDVLVELIEEEIEAIRQDYPEVAIDYVGGPSVSVYNARQIKRDTTLTLSIALIIIIGFILLVFKSRSAVFLIILPVIYGAAFSLALIWLIKGSVSAIAIGAGAAVFGVALSYSIHVLSHFNHVTSIRQLISELAYPLTVGSFTTVGAFLGLLFTTSELLRDFGLFSALSLVGTTLFCLVFLPHLLRIQEAGKESGRVLRLIEKLNSYSFEKNKPLVIGIVVVFVVCLFLSTRVGFDDNMRNLGYEPPQLVAAENRLNNLFQSDNKTILFVSVGATAEEGLQTYAETNRELESFLTEGKIEEYASIENLLIPPSLQQERIAQWNRFWTPERRRQTEESIREAAVKYRFRADAFDAFFALLEKEYIVSDFTTDPHAPDIFDEWTTRADSLSMYITQVRLTDGKKEEVYARLMEKEDVVIFDRGYFANKWVSAIHLDFNLILYICSFLVFFALLVAYGRIELTLMTFAPMAISWVIILGIMAVAGIQFNIVNIILATFIFGLGDDFSIFIMDGLQQEYRTGKKLLTSHKTAIFFSSFTAVVGMGVLVLAKHPALQSISLISILGMTSVVLVSYTILPILFRFFIARPAAKGHYPYTLSSLLVSFWFFNAFVIGCSLVVGFASILIILPVKNDKKKAWFNRSITCMVRGLLKMAWVTKRITVNKADETFRKPAVIIANHQSFIDILLLLALTPKLVMVTNNWVWNSPVFGRIVRFADFVSTREGYEALVAHLQKKVDKGYSVVVFPEGTRSTDGRIRRFHKGAFYLAEQLKLDLLPVLLYGTGMVISKGQPFYVKRGILYTEIMPRIPYGDQRMGATYQEQAKAFCSLFRRRYAEIEEEYAVPSNPHFYQKLITNYLFKGPVEEWYIRIKVKMEHNYAYFHELIPRKARITDIGCGYGPLDYMLMMLSEERDITGIDYDEDKIALANHTFSRNKRIRFVCANAQQYDLPPSDVFVLNDVLHYMDYAVQEHILARCAEKLLPGGMIVVRDGDASKEKQHGVTRFTEVLSTRLFRFNKTENELCFLDRERIMRTATQNHMYVEEKANDRYTSNTIYIFRKNEA
ncbi:1-acyl-sn-glycerol-3-phosphate acyltransferase [Parabacteroides sp. OttesenSCG-928-O15]|nr:1-acyl-sn-glycerol-3-phosphate acyltransferase [Parabacteroides sp. OttesenSCG-928-O15]